MQVDHSVVLCGCVCDDIRVTVENTYHAGQERLCLKSLVPEPQPAFRPSRRAIEMASQPALMRRWIWRLGPGPGSLSIHLRLSSTSCEAGRQWLG
jgi:hypothetical protein